MENDDFVLPRMPVDELDHAFEDLKRRDNRTKSMMILKHSPEDFFPALAVCNFARGVFRNVDHDKA